MAHFKGAKSSWMWLALRLFVGFQWASAGWYKLMDPARRVHDGLAWGELLVGLALMLGFATIMAAGVGAVMNIAFILSTGASGNAYLLTLQVILVLVGGAYAGYLGVDYWFRPIFRRDLARLFGVRNPRM